MCFLRTYLVADISFCVFLADISCGGHLFLFLRTYLVADISFCVSCGPPAAFFFFFFHVHSLCWIFFNVFCVHPVALISCGHSLWWSFLHLVDRTCHNRPTVNRVDLFYICVKGSLKPHSFHSLYA